MIPNIKTIVLTPGVQDWSDFDTAELDANTIVRGTPGQTIIDGGGSNVAPFSVLASGVKFFGVTFRNWAGPLMRLDQANGDIDGFYVSYCEFIDCTGNSISGGNPGYLQTNIRIARNRFQNCRIPIHFPSDTLAQVWVQDNHMWQISRMGVMLGNSGYFNFPDMGDYILSGNQFYDIDNPEDSDTHAILLYGQRGIVESNIIKGVKNPGDNCEGIYTKCSHGSIGFNTLHNAGRRWGQILVKGGGTGDGVLVSTNTITDDTEEGSFGIGVYADNTTLTHNHISGCARGIFVKNESIDDLMIDHNKIFNTRGKYAMSLAGSGNLWKLDANIINGVQSGVRDTGKPMAISISATGPLHRLVISGNEIMNVGTDTPENYGYGVYGDLGNVEAFKYNDNALDGMRTGMHLAGVDGPQRMTARNNDACNVTIPKSNWDKSAVLIDEGNEAYYYAETRTPPQKATRAERAET